MLHKILKQLLVVILACFLPCARAEIVDRIVAVVGDRVLSWSAARAEANYQAFRSGQEPPAWDVPLPASNEGVRQVVSRMVDQALLEQARDRSAFSSSAAVEIQSQLREIEQRYAEPEAYRQALARYHLAEAELAERLERESRLLAFIDSMLRPQARMDAEQIERYYQDTLLPELRRQGVASVPPLSEAREQIEEILTQQEINRQLERWLEELRRSAKIKIWAESEP